MISAASGGNLGALGVHAMVCQPLHAHGQERADADVQGDRDPLDAGCFEVREQARREVQSGGRRRHRTLARREHSLIIRHVSLGRSIRAINIGRQSEGSGPLERLHQGVTVEIERQADAAVRILVDHERPEPIGAFDRQRIACPQPAGVAGEHVPDAVGTGPVERDADPGLTSSGLKLCGEYTCVVGDQDVAGAEQRGQVADRQVVQPIGADVQHPGGIAWPHWFVRDAVSGEAVVEVGQRQFRSVAVAVRHRFATTDARRQTRAEAEADGLPPIMAGICAQRQYAGSVRSRRTTPRHTAERFCLHPSAFIRGRRSTLSRLV